MIILVGVISFIVGGACGALLLAVLIANGDE